MTQEEKLSYFKAAAGIVGFNFRTKELELLLTIYDKVLSKGGDTDLHDIVDIQIMNDRKYKELENKSNE